MNFHRSEQKLSFDIWKFLSKALKIEKQQRSKLEGVLSLAVYIIDYIIILTIIILQSHKVISIELPYYAFITIQILRIFFCILYLLSKQKLFLCCQNLCLFLTCLFNANYIITSVFTIFDFVSSTAWVLSIQQKYLHFDSRIFLANSFYKKALMNFFFIFWLAYGNSTQALQFSCAISVIFALSLILIDKSIHYYVQKFANFLLMLDLCCMLSAGFPLIYQWMGINLTLFGHLFLIIVNLWSAVVYSIMVSSNYEILFRVNPWQKKLSQEEIIQYFIKLKTLIQSDSQIEMTNFFMHHLNICKLPTCCLKIHQFESKKQDSKAKNALIVFMRQQLSVLSSKYKILHDFLIYNYFDKTQNITKYFDENNIFHLRERNRFFQQLKKLQSQNEKQSMDNDKNKDKDHPKTQIDIIPQINQFVNISLIFWQQLLEYNIDATKIIGLGVQKVQIYKKIRQILINKCLITEKSRIAVNNSLKYLFGSKQMFSLSRDKVEHNLLGLFQANPTIVISAETPDFLSIVDANIAATKVTGFSKSEILKLTIDQFWQKEIREEHTKLAYHRANYKQFYNGELAKSYAFCINKFGYAVFADATVYFLNDLKGKKWYVTMQPYLAGESAMVLNNKKELIGFNTCCLAEGFCKELVGKKMNENLFKQAINTKKSLKLKHMELFQDSRFALPTNLGVTHFLKFQSQIFFNNKPCYFVFTIGKRRQTNARSQSKASVSFQSDDLKQHNSRNSSESHSYGSQLSNKMSTLDPPQFAFSYDVQKQFFYGEYDINKNMQINKTNSVEDDQLQAKHASSELQSKKYDEDIIQMRLWDNTLDFIQNMQVPNHVFESFPQYKLQNMDYTEQNIRQNFQSRAALLPKNLLYLRIYKVLLFLVVLALACFININGEINKSYLKSQMSIESKMFDQLNRFVSLSTIIVGADFDKSYNITKAVTIKNKQIEQSYQQMQNLIPQFETWMNTPVRETTLQKSNDMFRLLIQNRLLSPNSSNYAHLDYLSKYVYPGWTNLLQSRLADAKNINSNVNKVYIAFIAVFAFLLVLFWVIIVRLVFSINHVANQISLVFLGIDHRAIVAEVAKLRSFKNYLDCNQSLIDEESIAEIREQENSQKIHQKRIINKSKRTIELTLIIIVFCFLITYFSISVRQQYVIQQIGIAHLDIMHNIYTFSLKMSMIWVGFNTYPRDYDQLESYRYNLQLKEREFQLAFLDCIEKKQITSNLKNYLISYSVGDGCIMMPNQNCSLNLNGTRIRGSKENNILYWDDYRNVIDEDQNQTGFITLAEGPQLFKLQRYYYEPIGKVVSGHISEEVLKIISSQQIVAQIFIIALVTATIFGLISYKCLAKKVIEFVELQTILTWLDFQILRNNRKYIQYLAKNKVNMR